GVGALDDEARRILRAASIFGEAFWAGGVAALLGRAERAGTVRERLLDLVEREVLVKRPESRFPGEEELAFRHALLREGAYAMLSDADRVLGHKLAGAWLERAGEGDPMVLAEHFQRGGEPARAVPFYARAAEQALRGQDTTAAIDRAARGLRAGAEREARASLLSMAGDASCSAADFRGAIAAFDEALSLSVP